MRRRSGSRARASRLRWRPAFLIAERIAGRPRERPARESVRGPARPANRGQPGPRTPPVRPGNTHATCCASYWCAGCAPRSGSDARATTSMASGPVEIPDTEHELVIERVAAIDVAKAAGKVCVRCPARRAAGSAGCGDARRHDLCNLPCPRCPYVGHPLGIHLHGLLTLCGLPLPVLREATSIPCAQPALLGADRARSGGYPQDDALSARPCGSRPSPTILSLCPWRSPA